MLWVGLASFAGVAFVVVPRAVLRVADRDSRRGSGLTWLAAGLFLVAWALPNPELVARTDTFTRHLVGGAACAVVGVYLALNLGVHSRLLRVLLVYGLVSSLGAAVETLELVRDEVNDTLVTIDTAWDIAANTLGAMGALVALEAGLWLKARLAPESHRPQSVAMADD